MKKRITNLANLFAKIWFITLSVITSLITIIIGSLGIYGFISPNVSVKEISIDIPSGILEALPEFLYETTRAARSVNNE
jgi:ABC-type enterochelin transport system permease subunit